MIPVNIELKFVTASIECRTSPERFAVSKIPPPRALRAPARVTGALLLLVVMVAAMLTVLPMQALSLLHI